MPVKIHNKDYFTVAERLEKIGKKLTGVETEVLFIDPQVMVKATITTDRGTFTGISAANPAKSIEKNTPVEVAETSAVGRALAFAGYAGSEIASANEMEKAEVTRTTTSTAPASPAQQKYIINLMRSTLTSIDEITKEFGVTDVNRVNKSNASKVIEYLRGKGEVH